ncbi:1-aminocyclopropane-1-carboxylate deaminase [Leptospira borgpetersenii]|uniref:1-aminocyclopropane-1-carboxylate deaminase n=1 Tax=Leptospira borgpetersenii TaxID=174 RepID=UPI00034CAA1A|nr:1-aminocyclopropane-1-carboxylate deaminase [Leptospira borgpetersenii]URD71154.1 1-aminocyclopropane-1-carboxylate deaminase [Leptospira borgpetersenii]UVD74332.1 1-aminocyclopropane-1-carboxylate deaminase [Leptospira borgpetersenii]UVD77528.1 1-aminocyclopropane-1-carboxylate deaminase [Leptospira borgpetersenii]UZW34096.1 1-aminocyclopropane-1-carboxylate deaminase [Leptospira borgpetersenii]
MHSLQVYFRSCLSPIYIQTVFKTQENELSILRDDRLAFGMGTKFRKFLGIHFALEKKDIRNVVLQGEFHSNALAAFAFLFCNFGYKVRTFCYARDRDKTSANSIFVRRNSHFLEKYNSRSEWENAVKRMCVKRAGIADFFESETKVSDSDENEILIPEYGFCRSALDGLDSLWGQIPIERYDRLVVDLGSGATWLSANRFFQNRTDVVGISIGLPKMKIISWLKEKQISLNLPQAPIEEQKILESKEIRGFGSVDSSILRFCNSFYLQFGVPIEPIYSGKSLYTIQNKMNRGELTGRILYIHQGGLWNFLDHFVDI